MALNGDPLWYKDAIIYQTHVKAFYDSDGDGIGDFRGLTEKLDYVRDLGANAIWLLPFYPSPMRDDGYDIADYRNIYPPYGTRRDFRRFVSSAHRRGIRVITELVINHTSDQHPWFQAARRAPKGSKKRSYYVWSDDDKRFAETRIIFTDSEISNWAWDPVAQQYYWHRFFAHQPDLNHNNPQVVRAVIRVMRFWLDMGVDGLRLDAIPYLCVREGTSNENLPETHAVLTEMRAVVDTHYANRMFLAEANQWPEDVREYFGDGDECHVAYHFPLMPRMYMALAQEDRHPVVEIMRQTPEIPPSCQWAIILRNHDELTLEMVSDRERDYMYETYAADPRMRVNVGIRRRLAPLLDNDQEKIRLMHSLLLSMPGTPILYYGDELGMGDNIYLGDRNAVRTPMQWSPDRNAGFSRADPQRLYLPPVMDPIYGYQSVNVETHQRDAASLLNWMRRLIAVRKAHEVFGRGAIRFLHPGNRKILAYVREGLGEGEAVLCIANLARSAQPVELDLGRFRGRVPVEMLGRTPFPPVGETPYLLTLPGHAFYWFLLSAEVEAPDWHEEQAPAVDLVTLVIPEGWRSLQPELTERRDAAERATARLEREVLPAYLRTRRWCLVEASSIRRVTLGERQAWGEWLLTLPRLESSDGSEQRFFLPLGIRWEGWDDESVAGNLPAALARVRRHSAVGLLYDAFADERFVRALAEAIGKGGEFPMGTGRILFSPTSAAISMGGERVQSFRRLPEGGESRAVLDGQFLLRGHRCLSPGIDPEVEVGRFLAEVSPYPCILPLMGFVEYRAADGVPATLGVLQGYRTNQGDLGTLILELLGRLVHAYGDRGEEWDSDPAQLSFVTLVDILGRRVAELHGALAQSGGGEAFDPEPIREGDLTAWSAQIRGEAEDTLGCLGTRLGQLPESARDEAQTLLARGGELMARVANLIPARSDFWKIRCHGDLHLGQILVAENDVVVVNFGGDASRPLAERRAKQCPLVDLASLVRSFEGVVGQALDQVARDRPAERERVAEPFTRWTAATVQRFLAAYRERARGAPYYPDSTEEAEPLLRLFTLRGALQEIRDALGKPIPRVEMPIVWILYWLDAKG